MKSFQEEIQRQAPAGDCQGTKALLTAWNRAFLNYTETAPNQWTDPAGEYSGDFSRAEVAVPFLRLLCNCPGGLTEYRDVIQGYIEFFAAIWRTDATPAERQCMLDFLVETAPRMPDISAYTNPLADALRKSVEK